jgi:DNA-binding NtrC family response regulator
MTQRDSAIPAPQRVLLVDDDTSFAEVMRFLLEEDGLECDVAADGALGLKVFESGLHPVVVTDLKMPRVGGLELLRSIKARAPDTLVIVITAFGDMATAVEAMKAGAFDFLPKPCDRDHFKLTVRRALEHWSLRAQVRDLRSRLDSADKDLIFRSTSMARVVALADRVAATDTTVLITGESGTGKELIARRLHRRSRRADRPFVALNCAAIPRDLLESELFGHIKGAFTGAIRDRKGRFEQADGGTLFLDEVGDLPADMQTRLLRVLQERVIDVVGRNEPVPVDVRIVSATNRELRRAVDAGEFREDLFFRLAVFPIEVPPLRDRREDIGVLAEHFVRQYAPERPFALSPELLSKLESFEWRGNIRELENLCQRMVLLAEDDTLTPDLAESPSSPASAQASLSAARIELPAQGISLVDLERDVIVRALEMNRYNQTQTAKFLRIPRHVLQYRIEKYQIPLKGRA